MKSEQLAKLLNLPRLTIDLAKVENLIRSKSAQPAFNSEINELLERGGKRLRPALLIGAASPGGKMIDKKILTAATAVEMIHQASLVHDAIADEKLSPVQINKYLLVGDYLLAGGWRLAASADAIMATQLAETIQQMAAGQALQLSKAYKADLNNEIYQTVITQKTAVLFAFCAQSGARLAGADIQEINAYRDFGLNFGLAFQILDDIQDGEFDANRRTQAQAEAEHYFQLAQKQASAKSLAGLPTYYLAKIAHDI